MLANLSGARFKITQIMLHVAIVQKSHSHGLSNTISELIDCFTISLTVKSQYCPCSLVQPQTILDL